MKKTIILALALTAPAMAGDDIAPVAVIEAPTIVAPAAPSPWALEVAGVHTWAMADAEDLFHNINSWGVDVTAVYNMNSSWAATLRFSWSQGSGRYFADYGPNETEVDKLDITNWSITAGVRYTAPITEKLSWYAGANLGWGRTEMSYTYGSEIYPEDAGKWDADDIGLSYSAEVGLKYNITPKVYATGAVGVRGMWTTPNWEEGYRSDQQFGVSVSAGLGWQF